MDNDKLDDDDSDILIIRDMLIIDNMLIISDKVGDRLSLHLYFTMEGRGKKMGL
jgi:hypothetical protein